MIPTIPVKSSDLHRCYTKKRPASAPEADSFIAPRLVYVHEMIRAKLRQTMQIIVSEIKVLFLSYMARNLLRLSDRLQSPTDIRYYDKNAEFII